MKRFAWAMAWGLGAALGSGAWSVAVARHAADAPTAHSVLSQARTAAGGKAWDEVATLQAQGQIITSGLPGSWRKTEDLKTGRWTLHADVGVFRVGDGHDGQHHWRMDASEGIHHLDAPFSRRALVTESWLTRRGWLRPQAAHARLGRVELRTEDGNRYAVLEAVPPGGEPVQLWFDTGSHHLARTVRQMPISVQTVRLDDYRDVGGLRLPFTIETRDSGSPDAETLKISQWTKLRALPASTYAAPTPPEDTQLAGATTVPLEIDGMVVVTAKLNGRAFDFILDTGGHNIITPDAAKALGVKPVGSGASGGAGADTLAQQYVRIDRLQIGDALMRDQHFYVLPFSYATTERGQREPLAGLIGLELFERLAVRIDYPGQRMTLRSFDDAGKESPKDKGSAVPIVFDDDMPLLMGRINGRDGLFALDTGNSGTTVVQAQWAKANGLADTMKRGVETVSYGAGGASRNWASRVDSIEVGGTAVHRQIARYAEDAAGAFSSRTEAANIGTDLLANFVVDIDYSRHVIWFAHRPGHQPPPFNRAGMRAMKDGPEAFRVVLVTPGSPAARAGIEAGDRITAVDGASASTLGGRELFAKVTQAVGTTVRLGVQRKDAPPRSVDVVLEELLP
ncbi:aspartyl protease family protein [Piscinibacter terrae]|uniref:PDZ domain-containing protein n=1 Tax=Piscinibacter terrae TaxID=2496871 RepID=A0A3N7HR55_9BURK|nr:aspartyl protease family protein [Albitalea terrae]RQP24674.1 PDZ domain-containing protein [Albitalea terrae]